MKERLITSCDVSSFTQPLLLILVITLRFVELSVVTDCNKSNKVNEDSEDDWGPFDNDNPLYLQPSC